MSTRAFLSLLVAFNAVAEAVELTNSDFDVAPGEDFTITWADAQEPVTIRLKSGDSDDLQTVSTITEAGTDESATWSVPANLDPEDYALEIEDASGDINYSIQFPIDGDGSGAEPDESAAAPSDVTETTTTASDPEEPTVVTSATVEDEPESTPADEPSLSPTPETTLTTESSTRAEPNLTQPEPSQSAEDTEATTADTTTDTTATGSATESESAAATVPDSGAARLGGISVLLGLTVACVGTLYF